MRSYRSWVYVCITTLVLFIILGCGNGSSHSTGNGGNTFAETTILDRSTSVAGPDTNADGVRDDVATVIDHFNLATNEKAACLEVAKSLQSTITAQPSRNQSITSALLLFSTTNAFYNLKPDGIAYLDRVMAYTVNTPERAAAYTAFETNLGGAVLRPTFTRGIHKAGRANTSNDICSNNGYEIAYINGINSTYQRSALSLMKLEEMVGFTVNGQTISYEQYYNPTDGLLQDLIEVAKQELAADGIAGRLEIMWAILMGNNGLVDSIINELRGLIPDIAQKIDRLRQLIYTKLGTAVSSIGPNPTPVVNKFVQATNVHVTEKKKILLVAHSQGNFFANAVYEQVQPTLTTASLGVVDIATPTTTVHGPYTTSDNDIVINAARLLNSALPANISVPFTLTDVLGHGFDQIYLNPGYAAKAKISADIQSTLNSLVAPSQGGASGFFTVTMTWDGTGDVDLHVIEPNGTHVYYGAKSGTSGYLDVDNVTANGPEHYYASCNSNELQTGVYQIGINNYARAAGRTATLVLATPDRIYDPISLDVGPVMGPAGNASPISVMSVRVDKDSNGHYTATQISTRAGQRNLSTYRSPFDTK